MAIKTKAELQTQVDTLLADNAAGDISASDIRTVDTDAIDSFVDVQDPDYIKLKDTNTFVTATPVGDDAGLIIEGQLSVGTRANPQEAVFGEGDSNTEGMVVLQTPDDVVYSDRTTIFASDTGSSTGMFGSTLAGQIVYVGSDIPSSGLKVKTAILGLVEPENVIAEYWNGSVWFPISYMATDADYPFEQRGWNIATVAGSEQWRFNFDPYNLTTGGVQRTINGITKYWARMRIVTNITLDPMIEQFKLHTNRFEINGNGFTEYFGTSRYKKVLAQGVTHLIGNRTGSPKNQVVAYTPTADADYKVNKFEDTNNDSTMFVLDIDEGLDTSIPIRVDLSFYVDSAATGDIEFILEKIPVNDGFVYDGLASPTGIVNSIVNVPIGANKVRKTTSLYLDINEAMTDTAFVMVVRRDATAGNANDNIGATIVLTHFIVSGYFWKP